MQTNNTQSAQSAQQQLQQQQQLLQQQTAYAISDCSGHTVVLSTERRLREKALQVVWNPTLDLAAILLQASSASNSDNSGSSNSSSSQKTSTYVLVARLNGQRVWLFGPSLASSASSSGTEPCSMAWRPDGQVLAIGHTDGVIRLYSTETGRELHQYRAVQSSSSTASASTSAKVTRIIWCKSHADVNRSEIDPERLLPPLAPVGLEPDAIISASLSLRQQCRLDDEQRIALNSTAAAATSGLSISKDGADVIVSISASGNIHLNLSGTFNIGSIGQIECDGDDKCDIIDASIAEDMTHLVVIVKHDEQQQLRLHQFRLNVLSESLPQTTIIANESLVLTRLLGELDNAINQLIKDWKSEIKEVNLRQVKKLDESILQQGREDVTAETELLSVFATGVPSPAVDQFIQHDLAGNHLRQWSTSIDTGCTSILIRLRESLQPIITRMLLYTENLHKVTPSSAVSMDKDGLNRLTATLGWLYIRCDQLFEVTHSLQSQFRDFISWIHVVTERLTRLAATRGDDNESAEEEASKTKPPSTNIDVARVVQFITSGKLRNDPIPSIMMDTASVLLSLEQQAGYGDDDDDDDNDIDNLDMNSDDTISRCNDACDMFFRSITMTSSSSNKHGLAAIINATTPSQLPSIQPSIQSTIRVLRLMVTSVFKTPAESLRNHLSSLAVSQSTLLVPSDNEDDDDVAARWAVSCTRNNSGFVATVASNILKIQTLDGIQIGEYYAATPAVIDGESTQLEWDIVSSRFVDSYRLALLLKGDDDIGTCVGIVNTSTLNPTGQNMEYKLPLSDYWRFPLKFDAKKLSLRIDNGTRIAVLFNQNHKLALFTS
ncbi:hypothetical protein GQ42DRAFT_154186 [Ramicandelaber brevisporus]|nr:hypothetical protein GQ42DRAFT_154186 [Ramicandelaber brevisporus]